MGNREQQGEEWYQRHDHLSHASLHGLQTVIDQGITAAEIEKAEQDRAQPGSAARQGQLFKYHQQEHQHGGGSEAQRGAPEWGQLLYGKVNADSVESPQQDDDEKYPNRPVLSDIFLHSFLLSQETGVNGIY